jgi:hypothetical protein
MFDMREYVAAGKDKLVMQWELPRLGGVLATVVLRSRKVTRKCVTP